MERGLRPGWCGWPFRRTGELGRAQGDGWAYQPTRSQTAQHGALGRERVAGSRVSRGEHPTLDFPAGRRRPSGWRLFAGPAIDRRRPRVDLVRRLPS